MKLQNESSGFSGDAVPRQNRARERRPWTPPTIGRAAAANETGPARSRAPVPRTVRFELSQRTGTFSNINAILYFASQKDESTFIVLAENNIVASAIADPTVPVVFEGDGCLHYHRAEIEAKLGMRLKLGEHQRPESYRDSDALRRRRGQLCRVFHESFRLKAGPVTKASPLVETIRGHPTVGAHVRFTGHFATEPPFEAYLDSYIAAVDQRLSESCEQVFLATHLTDVHAAFERRYGARLLWYEQWLNDDRNGDWFHKKPIEREREEVVIDMLALAACKHIVGGPSNVFYAALWWNPEIEFGIVPILHGVASW